MIKIKEKSKGISGFTLVELLAVIVILAIILVIAVPKVMSVIEDSKKATLESTAKMIASQAEKQKVQNTVLGKSDAITCDSVAKINNLDYASCSIAFDNNTAKVTIEGKGKFAGLNVCGGTKTDAETIEGECPFVCLGQQITIEKIDVTFPYVIKDVNSCINYLKENYLEYKWYLTENGIQELCSGGAVSDEPDVWYIKDVIRMLMDDNVLTDKESIENNVIEGTIVEEKVCVPDYADDAVTYINNLYNDTNVRNKFGLIKDNTTEQNIRYAGKYVQNYVEFGNTGELWRIIGTFEVETADGDTEKLLKIVRDDSIGSMSWDSSASNINYGQGVSEWSQADLKTMLNTYYIGDSTTCTYCDGNNQATCTNSCNNSITPINSTYRNMIESVVWNTGAIEWNYDGITPLQVYMMERTTSDSIEGKVGLIYPSDYGYAGGTVCTDITQQLCGTSNWLNGEYWTITFKSSNSVYLVNRAGYVDGTMTSHSYDVYPSLYLKSSVKIVDGDGSKDNPYKLKLS